MLENIQDILGYDLEGINVDLRSKIESDLVVYGSRESLRQVLLNCVLNALDAIHACEENLEKGIIEVSAKKGESTGKATVLIEIRDNGIGVSEEQSTRVFDPFYTTKPTGKGTGLGLYVSHLIIEVMSGRIWIEPNKQGGATVCIELPGYEDK